MNLNQYLNQPDISKADFANDLKVTSGMVSQWLSGHRPISPEKCLAIEKHTKHLVSREELRPDDYWLIWPDLKAPKKAA